MLTFAPDAKQLRLMEEARQFAREHVAKGACLREAEHRLPATLIREAGKRGFLGVNIPTALGGREAGVVAYVLVIREIARADGALAVTMAVSSMVAEMITKFGTPAQHKAYVPRLVSGEFMGGSFALSEPGCGSDPGNMVTRATRDGNDWLLNGEKMWISTGDQAGVHVVWARTGGPGAKGLSCFLVGKDTPGLGSGKPEEKMGLRASHTVSLSLNDVRVSSSAMLGNEGQGFKIAMTALDGGRLGVASQALGMGFAALTLAKAYTLRQQQLDHLATERQAVEFKLADIAVELDAAFLLTLRAAWRKETGKPFTREAAMAKMFAAEAANRAVRDAVQILGEDGGLEENGAARLFRDCRVTQIYEGTSEIQRMVIAREELR